jgi:Domain of Unknown Function with PDB structure (DUF3857)
MNPIYPGKLFFCFGIFLLMATAVLAQDQCSAKFGNISPKDFEIPKNSIDSGANAIVIADIGKSYFEGNNKGGYTLYFTHYMRVKILTKNGFDIAKQMIYLYTDGKNEEKLDEVKGSTYNMENNRVIGTKLEQNTVFTDKLDKNFNVIKFTMPALKAGSIFEISYKTRSDFNSNMQSWSFDGEYPCLWSEYEVNVPPFFSYVTRFQGNQHFDIDQAKNKLTNYTVNNNASVDGHAVSSIDANATVERWVKKNVPAFHLEDFTTTLRNHISKLSFQLQYIQYGEHEERYEFMPTWRKVGEQLYREGNMLACLEKDNNWLKDELPSIIGNASPDREKAYLIYSFVRDHFKRIDGISFYSEPSLRQVYKSRSGNEAALNLLLTAMLKEASIFAEPALLSTRENGYATQAYPLIEEYNYVICVAKIDDNTVCLDASEPLNGFGNLREDCYNGNARVIDKERPYPVNLSADSLKETRATTVFIMNDDKGQPTGNLQSVLGNLASYRMRMEVSETSLKEYFKKKQAAYRSGLEIENMGIDSLDSLEQPVTYHFDFNFKDAGGDMLYFDPIFDGYRQNPFMSAARAYPVEMPYPINNVYVLNMEIPKGYAVDEMPKSEKVAFNGNEGFFEYIIQKDEANIQLHVAIKLNKAIFPVADYQTLRDFFDHVVKKESEQIVFKKIK